MKALSTCPYVPQRTVVGLPNGYLQFGTLAHRVLLALREHGDLRNSDLVELLDEDERHVGMALSRLARFLFIYRRRKVGVAESNERTQALWTLKPCSNARYTPLDHAARCVRYRAKRRLRAPSVFQFRGQIAMERRA